jgi:hypothetical protein
MRSSGYTVLGWIVWQLGSRVAKRKMSQNRAKLGAAGVVLLVVVGGILAARAGGDDYAASNTPAPVAWRQCPSGVVKTSGSTPSRASVASGSNCLPRPLLSSSSAVASGRAWR